MAGAVQQGGGRSDDPAQLISRRRYRKWAVLSILAVSAVAVLPLLIMSGITYNQYQEAFHAELTRPMLRFAAAGKQSIESFLSDRLSAITIVARESSFEDLRESRRLDSLLTSMKQTFEGVVDLGLLDEQGLQVSYAGPYGLQGADYAGTTWFQEVSERGSYVSDVFTGYRNLPHIVMAIHRDPESSPEYVLRATIASDVFHWLVRARTARRPEQARSCRGCHALGVQPFSDAFVINAEGVLQTPSRLYGGVLERTSLPPLAYSTQAELVELVDERGESLIVSYAHIQGSPFTLVLVNPRVARHEGLLSLRRDLLVFPLISSALILAVVIGGVIFLVRRAREAEMKRAALYHKMEYTNKMAAIGRLGAGVAHEINNPLSIITEKAGLLKDLLTAATQLPPREKLVSLVNSVINSAERCGGITHRLLGFAKHMEVQRETIDLDELLRQVLGFLEKEASYRDIRVEFNYPEEPPPVVSDRGQLQQVFLNIVNNAFAAVEDGGHIEIRVERAGRDAVSVTIADDGVGISEAQLQHIFDPFFTTKKGAGTGLGLSITYGIVQKLGGQISVKSTVGVGTQFTVILPTGRTNS